MNKWTLPVLVTILAFLVHCEAYKFFQQQIPNGEIVPHPCKANFLWRGVGHENLNGGGMRNAFGRDFNQNGRVWNTAICMMDSDGDGMTNGVELGDPDCTWTPGTAPKYSAGLSHPGVCEPLDDPKCAGQTDFVDCSSEGFTCSGINDTDTFTHEVRFPVTDVPAEETTYMCMLFEFPTHDDFHIIANTPYLDNEDVMHHILIYGCDPERNVSSPLNTPFPSNMQCDSACNEIIGLWTVGSNGYCMNSNVGFKVGASGYRIAAIEMHWNNPLFRDDYKDSSGMTFYLTPNIRPYDAGVLMTGQGFLEIPPGQHSLSTHGGCAGSCTLSIMEGPVYIMEAFNHMHYLGAAQRTRLVRNNQSIDLAYDPVYSYDSPVIHAYDDPIIMNPGDDIMTTCTFKSTSRTKTTYYGESTSDEMCFAFLIYYPKQNFRTPYCVPQLGISPCEYYSGNLQGCDTVKWANSSDPEMAAMYASVWENCAVGTCKAECLALARELKKHPCLSGDVTKLFRSQIEERHSYTKDANEIIFYAKIDSCDSELAREQCPTCRDGGDGMVDSAGELQMGLAVLFAVLMGRQIV